MEKKINEGIDAIDRAVGGGKKWEDYDTIVCPDGSIIDMQKLLDDQDKAVAMCRHIAPAFGGLVSKLNLKYTFQVATQATDGFSIYINPQFTAQELDTPTKKVAVLLHEVMHCLLQHMRRGQGHDPERSNIAADYEVNSTLTEMGLIKRSTWEEIHALYDEKYKDMGYESIYEAVGSKSTKDNMANNQGAKQAQNNQVSQSGGDQDDQPGNTPPQGADGPAGGNQQGQGSSNQDNQDNQSNQGSGNQGSQKQNKDKGPGQGGGMDPSQPTRDDPDANGKNQGKCRPQDCMGQAAGKLTKIPGKAGGMISKNTGDQISQSEGYDKDSGNENAKDKEWAQDAQKAADEASRMQGKGQGWGIFVRKINSINRVTTNWKKALQRVVGRSLSEEDKRQAFANKNTLVSQNRIARTDKDKYNALNDIVAMVDTSGSMSDDYKAACLKQVYQVANQKKACRMIIIPFDDGPQDVIIYDNINKLYNDIKNGKTKLKGGGGTDVRPCFQMLKTDKRFKGRVFELIMIFTDGELDQVKRDPKICQHLCWVIADNPNWDLKYKEKNTYRITMDQRDFE